MKIWSLLNDLRYSLTIPLCCNDYTQTEHHISEYHLQIENLIKKKQKTKKTRLPCIQTPTHKG